MRHNRRNRYVFGFIVRHTPPLCGTPLREGMGCRITLIINKSLPRHPLSERGGRRPGCVALSNWLSVESGQSVVLLMGRFAQNLKKIFFKIIQICHNEGKALQKCRFCAVSTSVVVRLLSARCPFVVRLMNGQQSDNNRTTNGQRPKEVL